MKRIITAALTLAAALSCFSVTAFAAEDSITVTDPDTTVVPPIAVTAEYHEEKEYVELILGETESANLSNGGTIRISSGSDTDDGLRVMVIPVTEAEEGEAYAWLKGEAAKKEKGNPLAYYIAFFNEDGNPAIPQGVVKVTLTQADGYESSKLFYMNGAGESSIQETVYTAANGNAVFQYKDQTKYGYYFFANAAEGPDKPDKPTDPDEPTDPDKPDKPTEPDKPVNPDSPQTGDESRIGGWIFLALASLLALALLVWEKLRERFRSEKE